MTTPRYVRVLCDFSMPRHDEIPLRMNDIVEVTGPQEGDRLYGSIGSNSGYVPRDLVEFIHLPDVIPPERIFGAMETYQSGVDGDLNFRKGEVIIGIEPLDENWWRGHLQNRVGMFPLTLVKPLETSSSSRMPTAVTSSVKAEQKPAPSTKTTGDSRVKARANSDMMAQLSDELSFKEGDTIWISQAEDEDFYLGECNGKTGSFPIHFVEIIEKEKFELIRYKGRQRRTLTSFGQHASFKYSPEEEEEPSIPETVSQPIATQQPVAEPMHDVQLNVAAYARSLYPFAGQSSDELTFAENQIIELVCHVDDQWTMGRVDDQCGIFPTSFVEILVDCPSAKPSPKVHDSSVDYGQTESSVTNGATYPHYGETMQPHDPPEEPYLDAVYGPYEAEEISPVEPMPDADVTDPTLTARIDEYTAKQYGNSQTSDEFEQSSELDNIYRPETDVTEQNSDMGIITAGSVHGTAGNEVYSREDDKVFSTTEPAEEGNTWRPLRPNETEKYLLETTRRPVRPAPPPPKFVTRPNSLDKESMGIRNAIVSDLRNRIEEIQRDLQEEKVFQGRPTSVHSTEDTRMGPNSDLKMELCGLKRSLSQLEPEALGEMGPLDNIPADISPIPADNGPSREEKRGRIIQEILETEQKFLSDMKMVHEAFLGEDAPSNESIDTDTLFGNMVDVISLSTELRDLLARGTEDKSFEDQCVGQIFLDLKYKLIEVYAPYCRNHDDVIALLAKYEGDQTVEKYINGRMDYIKQFMQVFDLGSMLIKPVQRIMKYPLLLNELMKCTDDSHQDKQKIIAAIGAMTDVAHAINEHKRRKDLVFKYRRESDSSISDKISRLNFHSLRKKSHRVSTRMSTSFGISATTRDMNFDQLESMFKNTEKLVRSFLRSVQYYMEQLEIHFNNFELCDVEVDEFYQRTHASDIDTHRLILRSIGTDCMDRLQDDVTKKVCEPLLTLSRLFQGPSNVIKKRYDKLLDYDHLTSRSKDTDTLAEELKRARETYEALNAQLLFELPQFNSLGIAVFKDCMENFVSLLKAYHQNVDQEFRKMGKILIPSQAFGSEA